MIGKPFIRLQQIGILIMIYLVSSALDQKKPNATLRVISVHETPAF